MTLTADAIATLDLFHWVIQAQTGQHTLIADDQTGVWKATTASLNAAALTADERTAAQQDLWAAQDDWCDRWDGHQHSEDLDSDGQILP